MGVSPETLEAINPPGLQIPYSGSFRENLMLGHISRTALRLPQQFDQRNMFAGAHVWGTTEGPQTSIKIEEEVPEEGEGAIRLTDVGLLRSTINPKLLLSLGARRYVTDDIGDIMGLEPAGQTFNLGAEENTLSMFRVMCAVSLAASMVQYAFNAEYYSRPEVRLTQLGTF